MTNLVNNIVLRICKQSLSFASLTDRLRYEPYIVNSSISIAANLREAFRSSPLLAETYTKSTALIDSEVMLLPEEEYRETDNEQLYRHSFHTTPSQTIMHMPIKHLSAVAVFAVDSDLLTVLRDHYDNLTVLPLTMPTWKIAAQKQELINIYACDNFIEITAFERNRFLFYNRYNVKHVNDAVYFIVNVRKQLKEKHGVRLMVKSANDKQSIAASLNENLAKYVDNIEMVEPDSLSTQQTADTNIQLPFDMMCFINEK